MGVPDGLIVRTTFGYKLPLFGPFAIADMAGPDVYRVQDMLDKVLPYTNYWHVKNYLRDEDATTGQVMTFPVPMDFGLINYRAPISQALDLGFRGAFLCEHDGSDAIAVIGKNRAYIRDILGALID